MSAPDPGGRTAAPAPGAVSGLLEAMTPAEVSWGWVPGAPWRPAADPGRRRSVVDALEDALRPALCRPPCLVQFSGGRDSSVVLAVALGLARREGLPEPVAFTRRFPGYEEADERAWQERVVAHLRVAEWERMEVADELDLVGPVAGPSLVRHGVVWPPMVHVRAVDLSRAAGGAMLDGEGGDEVLGPGRLHPLRAMTDTAGWRDWRSPARAGLAVAPASVRRRALGRLLSRRLELPWLRPAAWAALRDAVAADEAGEPLGRRRALLRHVGGRGLRLFVAHLAALAREHDVVTVHPLLDPGVAAAVGDAGGPFGFAGRTAAMRACFGGILPDEVLSRTTKAQFNRVVFNEHSRAFAASWDGTGVDAELVDVDALRRTWAAGEVHAMSFALLQSAWLRARRDR